MSTLDQSINTSNLNSASTGKYDIEINIISHYKNCRENLSSINNSKQINIDAYLKRIRKDKYGNPISRKTKQHKVSFLDEFEKTGREFIEVKVVQSIKEFYNITRVDVEGKKCFGCNIF